MQLVHIVKTIGACIDYAWCGAERRDQRVRWTYNPRNSDCEACVVARAAAAQAEREATAR